MSRERFGRRAAFELEWGAGGAAAAGVGAGGTGSGRAVRLARAVRPGRCRRQLPARSARADTPPTSVESARNWELNCCGLRYRQRCVMSTPERPQWKLTEPNPSRRALDGRDFPRNYNGSHAAGPTAAASLTALKSQPPRPLNSLWRRLGAALEQAGPGRPAGCPPALLRHDQHQHTDR